jgi:hypothetical protein
MAFREIFDRERENLSMLILSLFTWLVLYVFDFLKLKEKYGLEIAFAVYSVAAYLIYISMCAIYEKFVVPRKIKFVQSKKMFDENIQAPFTGKIFYGYLDVLIPSEWIITDCYITLERVIPVYYEDKVLLDRKISEWFSNEIKPEYKMLHWRSPSSIQNATKINIGENSNRESISIGKITIGKIVDTDIKAFEFDVQKFNPNELNFMQCGLYEFSITFHGKRNGRETISKKVDGYIYSRAENWLREIRVGLGDYHHDADIPKPLIK